MKKSSNVKNIRVKQEEPKKRAAVEIDFKALDLKELIQMGLQDFMFEVCMLAVQQAMDAEVNTCSGVKL